jgi:hypothetical protein
LRPDALFYDKMATRFALLFGLLLVAQFAQAAEPSTLVRVTAYWREEGQLRASSNGAHLRNGHCAVDPKKIPYGSKIILDNEELIAVDTGPAVVSRKAARLSGRNRAEREAMVVDRYFETKSQAMAWEKSHPQFMQIQIVTPGKAKAVAARMPSRPLAAPIPRGSTSIAPQPAIVSRRSLVLPISLCGGATLGGATSYFCAFSEPSTEFVRSARRRTGSDAFFAGLKKGRGPLERLRLSWLETS